MDNEFSLGTIPVRGQLFILSNGQYIPTNQTGEDVINAFQELQKEIEELKAALRKVQMIPIPDWPKAMAFIDDVLKGKGTV